MGAAGFLYGIAGGGGAGEMIAEWIVDGRPSLDLWPLDVRRFGPHHGTQAFMYPRAVEHYAHHYKMRYPSQEHETARNLRRSPFHERLLEAGAVMGSKNGWERPLWFAPNGIEPIDQLDFLKPGWHVHAAEEHRAVRERVALIDQTSFSKFELIGVGALPTLQRLAACNIDRPVGSVLYAQLCNARGGIEADLTIVRLAPDHFYIVTGAGFGGHDSDWIRRHLPSDGSAHLIEVTSARAVLNLCGPAARDVLQAVSESDVSNDAFPFATANEIVIGAAPVRALRIGYVGELGWELHIPTEFGLHVYEHLIEAGAPHGMRHVGYRAIDGLRMEKGYLYWSADISPDYSPIEAGLSFRVHLSKDSDFLGREVLAKQTADGVDRKLMTFTSDRRLPLYGGEAVLRNGDAVGVVSSAGFGHAVGKHILFSYLDRPHWDETDFEVEVFGARWPVTPEVGPLYDPTNSRLKA